MDELDDERLLLDEPLKRYLYILVLILQYGLKSCLREVKYKAKTKIIWNIKYLILFGRLRYPGLSE